ATLCSDVLIVLAEVPQPSRPRALHAIKGDQRPVFVAYLRPNFRRESRGTDRAGTPPDSRSVAMALAPDTSGFGDFGAALLHPPPPIPGQDLLHGFDQRGQRGFGVAGDRDVGFH